jgi:cation diffusion facilitator family transporter
MFDLIASGFAFWGVRMASQPPDRSHPYGHEKFENFSSLVQVTIIAIVAVFIVGGVVFWDRGLAVSNIAIGVVTATMVVDYLVARYIGGVAKRYRSSALEADAFHFTSDLWVKAAVIIGLVGARLGAQWLDPVAALAVAAVMVFTAFHLGLRSTRVLLDTAPPSGVEDRVCDILRQEVGNDGFHSLRMRQAGKWVFLDVALHLPGETKLSEAHDWAHRISSRLCQEIEEVRDAVVHLEPEDHPDAHHDEHFREG